LDDVLRCSIDSDEWWARLCDMQVLVGGGRELKRVPYKASWGVFNISPRLIYGSSGIQCGS